MVGIESQKQIEVEIDNRKIQVDGEDLPIAMENGPKA